MGTSLRSAADCPPPGSFICGCIRLLTVLVAVIALAAFPTVRSAQAQITYSVNDTGDAGDFDLGDAVCNTEASGSPGPCTLRAALEQANALSTLTPKDITFTDLTPGPDGTITFTPTSGDFIVNGQAIRIRGDQVGGSGWTEGDPPVVYIDAGNLSGSGANGLDVRTDADSSSIVAVGVINAPSNGIQLRGDIDQINDTGDPLRSVSIQYCWVGVKRDGTAAGNGSGATFTQGKSGIRLTNAQNTIVGNPSLADGALNDYSALYLSGGRNVISGNIAAGNDFVAGSGIVIDNLGGTPPSPSDNLSVSFASNDNVILGNYIGLTPDGSATRGNDGFGIVVDDRNRDDDDPRRLGEDLQINGNVVAGNGAGGLSIYGTNITVRRNALGTSADGSTTLVAPADGTTGITIRNTARNLDTIIGGDQAADANLFGGYDVGIEFVKSSAYPTAGDRILSNRFGRSAGGADLPLGRAAILLATSDSVDVEGNTIGNVGDGSEAGGGIILDSGAATEGRDHRITDNYIGVTPQDEAIPVDGTGIYLRGGRAHRVEANVIGNASRDGIWRKDGDTSRDFTIIRSNDIGRTEGGEPVGNGGYGVRVGPGVVGMTIGSGTFADSTSLVAAGNRISSNGAGGVRISGADTKEISVRGNAITGASGQDPLLDIGTDGPEGTDANDDDDGTNELMNTPEITSTQCTEGFNEDTATVRVLHESADEGTSGIAGRPDYGTDGLRLDFYSTSGQLLRAATYTLEGSEAEVIIEGPGVCDEIAFVSATDADGNTSEYPIAGTPLPVELASLTASVWGSRVRVAWVTASETGNAGFTVEHRAPEATTWRGAAFVEGAGTTDQTQRYRVTVSDLKPGVHAFRLRQLDADGSESISRTVTADVRLDGTHTLEVGPNPVAGRARVALTLRDGQHVRVALYDVLGRQVKTIRDHRMTRGEHVMGIATTGLGSGSYFLRIEGDTFVTTRRIAVVR